MRILAISFCLLLIACNSSDSSKMTTQAPSLQKQNSPQKTLKLEEDKDAGCELGAEHEKDPIAEAKKAAEGIQLQGGDQGCSTN